ncbi:SPOR domain-containing protein [Altererythrobacter aerius]|uniref:SPOR domain-containing protein n=1 Tax=Tsuneonella aeria TaxID=1837929 RepID=A0A6I4THJ7_9SPHN|nr:SPOR domain-containing protein [Tsuneonella aeria]MXO76104.1 SPOR domain-containing protein [Tsuneonella aeria]
MTRTAKMCRMLALFAGTALASASLTGCATQAAPRADLSAGKAEAALKKGNVGSAVANAEAAVLADPRNAAYRTMLGAAYMEAGRFLAARTSFDDAMTLGDASARTALGYVLASIAAGERAAALQVLGARQNEIPASDLGLALALAGETREAVHVLTTAVRSGDNTPKSRQNLAYALALNGEWAGARIMAAEDVPADQLDARLQEWAQLARPESFGVRVASVLGTRIATDPGQPVHLALANHPTIPQLAAEAEAFAEPLAPTQAAEGPVLAQAELPPADGAAYADVGVRLAAAAPAPSPQSFDSAFTAEAAASVTAVAEPRTVTKPVVQPAPARVAAARPSVRRAPARAVEPAATSGNHLVQLGSFSSEAAARRAWGIYVARIPQLSGFDMVITKAVVRGKTYYRVSAGGLQRAQAGSICSSVKSRGQACFAWSQGRPMPGAVARTTRMAAR